MTENNETQPIKLSTLNPKKTAGQLPSSRTYESCFIKPLESDNIEEVKAALIHVWLHYQALELAVSDRDLHTAIFENVEKAVQAGTHEKDMTDLEMAVSYIAGGIIESAYDVAHIAGQFSQFLGLDPMEALKVAAFDDLDFTDPEREVTDAELEKLLNEEGQTLNPDTPAPSTDETPKDEK